MNISMYKKYRAGNGLPVEILKTGLAGSNYPVVAVITHKNGSQASFDYTACGNYHDDGSYSDYDLVELKPYEDFKIDQPVYVRFTSNCGVGSEYYWPRHFAGVSDSGSALVYGDGLTSHTNGNKIKLAVHECLSVEEYKTKFN